MPFYAHSTKQDDKSDWEELPSHLGDVARLAERLAAPLGLGKAARLAGRLHDLGKFDPAFQRRLSGDRRPVDHSTAGAAVLIEEVERAFAENGRPDDRMIAQLVAQGIAGHHAGLPDRRSSEPSSLDERIGAFDRAVLDEAWRGVLPLDLSGLLPKDFRFADAFQPFQLFMLGRMVFSCLVDADFKATEAFYARTGGLEPDRDWPSLAACLPAFLEGFERTIADFPAGTELGSVRAEILAHVRARAALPPGLFTLNVPTGGGKTLASLGFALDHARIHGHGRIIASIPFTSIIEQTAAIFCEVLGEANVLEHHSAIEEEEAGRRPAGARAADSGRAMKDKMRLAMEDWAAPVVVTTHVQLFESLFAARTSRSRKLHNIANSILILDEAQVLPPGLLGPTVRAMEELARNYGCSVVLCTATQPAFDARHYEGRKEPSPLALPLEGRELAPDPPRLHRQLRRATLRHAGEMTDAALVEALAAHPQALVVVNSRAHALALYRLAEARGLDGLVHLTTRQYAAHRMRILADVRRRLENGRPCRLIATSLIEAGVDVDFPVAWRAEAGLDQIVQAAGRVNREGTRAPEASAVTVFEAAEAKAPGEFRPQIEAMRRVLARHADDPSSPEATTDYFREVYWQRDAEMDEKRILTKAMMTCDHAHGADIAFRSIAEAYRMIEERMVPVIVAGDETARKALEDLEIETIPSGAIARRLQRYVVQVPPSARAMLLAPACGHVAFRRPDLRGDQFAVLRYDNLYADDVGLLWEDPSYLAVESTMF